MRNIHPAAWIGMVINLAVGLFGIGELSSGHYPETLGLLSRLLGAGIALNLAGAAILALGRASGGLVGAVGSIVFIPVGFIALVGFLISRNRIKLGLYEGPDRERDAETVVRPGRGPAAEDLVTADLLPDDPAQSDRAQTDLARFNPVRSDLARSDLVDKQTRKNPTQSNCPARPGEAAKSMPAHSAAVSDSAGRSAEPAGSPDALGCSGPAADPAPDSGLPSACFGFADPRLLYGLMVVGCIAAFRILSSTDYALRAGTMVLPILFAVVIIVLYSRVAGWNVFALYDDYLEAVPNLCASPLKLPYASIVRASQSSGRVLLYVRRPGGGEDKIPVSFNFIKGSEREAARAVMRAKLEELGVLEGD